MLKVIFFVGVVAFVFQFAGTSVVECPKSNNVENLNMEKMLGQWYIARDNYSDVSRPCFLISFHKTESNKFTLELCVMLLGFHCGAHDILKIPDDILSKQIVYKTGNMMQYDISVREIDYDNYAVIQFRLCPYNPRENVITILSRNQVYDTAQLDKLTTKYIGNGTTWTHSTYGCPKDRTTTN